jgi:hypothetical protein
MSKYEKNIRNQLIYFLGSDSDALKLIGELSTMGDLLFLGGSIRDICLSYEEPSMPRDFDIAIKCINNNYEDLEVLLKQYNHTKNRFGGYKVRISNIEFDIWALENTWAFKNTDLMPNEENLAKSVYLSIDGIVYNFNKAKLYDEVFRSSLQNSKIDITLEKNPQVELNLLRALVFKEKYNLQLSNKLKDVFKAYLKEEAERLIENLYELQVSHYKEGLLSKEKIKKELQYI